MDRPIQLLCIAALCVLCWTPLAHADAAPDAAAAQTGTADEPADDSPDRALTSGLALGTGAGSDNIFFGGHIAYYAQLPNPRLRFIFHVGAGVMPYADPDVRWGVRGGAYLAYGKRHRLVIGAYGGTIAWTTYSLHGVDFTLRPNYGIGSSVGYEWMHAGGLYLRCTVGPALAMRRDEGLIAEHRVWVWRANFFAIGYKLW